jgi:hypothetical protein
VTCRLPSPAIRCGVFAAACWFGSWAAGAFVWPTGPLPALIKVRWDPAISAERRAALEAAYSLAQPQFDEGTSYRYVLLDVSEANIRRLVHDPAVLDTHDIDRATYRIAATASRSAGLGVLLLDLLGDMLAAIGSIAGLLGAAMVLVPLTPWGRRHRWIAQAGVLTTIGRAAVAAWYATIPPASARQAAAFRIVFGLALLSFFATNRVDATTVPTTTPDPYSGFLERVLKNLFIANPALADWITPWIVLSAALVIVGAATRWAFAALAAGAAAWGVVNAFRYSSHSASALLLALLCLVPARWGDAWSLDAWRRRRRGHDVRAADPRDYGWIIWMPGFVLGVTLCAAAVAKLRAGGLGWIFNGTVKYHFLTDFQQAPVTWGLLFGRYHTLAVAASFAAIAIEAGVLVGAISSRRRVRMAAGIAAAGLLTGIYLFQGIFWPCWWMLLLSFAPWSWIDRLSPPVDSIRHAQLPPFAYVATALAAVVAGQQVIVSWQKLEIAPLLSAYDMYSKTYGSPEENERSMNAEYRLVAYLAGSDVRTCRIEESDGAALLAATEAKGARTHRLDTVLRECFGSLAVERIEIEVAHFVVDWKQWRPVGFVPVQRVSALPEAHRP